MAETTTNVRTASAKAVTGKGLSLGGRFFLASAAIVVVALGVAVVVTATVGQNIASEAVGRTLERSASVQSTFQEKTLDELRLVARLFANDPIFAAYISEAIQQNDPLSIIDQLQERQDELGFDLAIVLDPDGRLVARTDELNAGREDLSSEALVIETLNEYEAFGVWESRGGQLYHVASVPIGAGGLLEGFLVAGRAIDDDAVLELRRISGTEVSFVLTAGEPRFAASTLEKRASEELTQLLAERPELLTASSDGQLTELTLDREEYYVLVRPLVGVTPDEEIGVVLSLASIEEHLAPFRRIRSTLLGVGLAAVLMALVASFLLPRPILEPLRSLAGAAKAAADGDYDQRVELRRGDEVGQLAAAFDSLLSDLREKRDMELYISELAKNVPDEQDLLTEVFQVPQYVSQASGQTLASSNLPPPPPGAPSPPPPPVTPPPPPGADLTQQMTETMTPPEAISPTVPVRRTTPGGTVINQIPGAPAGPSPVATSAAGPASFATRPTLAGIGPGSQLGGRFKILSQLGEGGMGVVFKARDDSLAELVALKMLRPSMWDDEERLTGLKEELKIARRISHPNVLRTFDFGELEGVPFISMEYVRGITLRQLLDRSGRLPMSAGLRLARQLCRGLRAAHADGVLHRDIKPENLIVEHTGNAKLMDFGIAQRMRRKSSSSDGTIAGTPFYLAPEQLQGKEADERSDLYACGVVLYELFTGKLPYPPQGSIVQIITTKMNQDPTPPREHWATIPDGLERIILRCMEREPANRFQDVGALLEELESLRA